MQEIGQSEGEAVINRVGVIIVCHFLGFGLGICLHVA